MKKMKYNAAVDRFLKIPAGMWILYGISALIAVFILNDLRQTHTRLARLQNDFDQFSSWKNREDSILIQRNVFQPISRGQFSIQIRDIKPEKNGIRFHCAILNMTSVAVSDFRITPVMKEVIYEGDSHFRFRVNYLTNYTGSGVHVGRIDSGRIRDFSFFVKDLKIDDIYNIIWKRQTLIAFWIEQHRVHPRGHTMAF